MLVSLVETQALDLRFQCANTRTIHGRARYPGLHIWARNTGKRMSVKIPPGKFMLVQAGKQFEYLTGGYVRAGYHEVVVNDQTIEACFPRHGFNITILFTDVNEIDNQSQEGGLS